MHIPPSILGMTYLTRHGTACTVMALARDSETEEEVVVYTSEQGIYWVLPRSIFDDAPIVRVIPPPRFTVRLGAYQHFKGSKYAVVVRTRDARTEENKLVYTGEDGAFWVRPERMFLDEVVWPDGVTRTRFIPLDG